MSAELNRIKQDLETMQRALGLAPSLGRDWVDWLKRDRWFSLWWCIPGVILIGAAVIPHSHTIRYGGLVIDQWAGCLVAAVMLGIAGIQTRRVTANDSRSAAVVREAKRINGLNGDGLWGSLALGVQGILYFFWSQHYRIGFEPFWAGYFLVMGSSLLLMAMAARVWLLLGWALPFLAYGAVVPLVGVHSRANGILFGLMFVAVALSFSFISSLQIRALERQNDAH